jgi:prepilin-type N-terminal cleavage/methylation domain-containing protein
MQFSIRSLRRPGGFTLIELLAVMAIIAVLAGLILSLSGFANKRGALSRAQSEIQAISAACESYKADNGSYPHQLLAVSGSIPTISGTVPSDILYPAGSSANGNSSSSNSLYINASLELYEALTGDLNCTGTGGRPGVTNYIVGLKQDVFGRTNMSGAVSAGNPVYYLSDPFGNSYGYSTAAATIYSSAIASGSTAVVAETAAAAVGYNPTYDLWSTGGQSSNPFPPATSGTTGDPMLQWVANWHQQ